MGIIVIRTVCLGAGIAGLVVDLVAAQPDPALERARRILRASPLVDSHNDLPFVIREDAEAPGDVDARDLRKRAKGDTDLGRLRKGQVGAQFWSVYIPGEIKDSGYARVQLEQIDIARRVIERYPEALQWVTTAAQANQAFQAGKIGSFIGMEGGHAIENSLGALRIFARLGVRYMTLTHNVTLDWADAALDVPRHNGLTPFGKEVVREMNRLGMVVDISHVTPKVMHDALDVTEAPVMFSHSSAKALTNHPRNVPDDVLARMKANGGVVMVTFIPAFVSQAVADWDLAVRELTKGNPSLVDAERIRADYARTHPRPVATLRHVADHIEHVRKVAGVDHVGVGSDFYGSDDMPKGLEDVSTFPDLFAELIRRGWSDTDLMKLSGRNILRVLRQNESVARRLQKERRPSTATIDKLDRGGKTSDSR
ncbi:MAG: membrane dipeptidase [Gemmatimonadetes bacterium]|nr:membrane dipeptidase [Gemmatimonadota bacterium]